LNHLALTKQITAWIRTYGLDRKYWLAYSGGLDSHVLLHLFASVRSIYPIRLQAVYVNHGVSPHAVKWAEHCAQICDALNVEFLPQELIISPNHSCSSPEDQLRQFRYQLFAKLLAANDMLLTAHHQNDQAETVLLQLCRGAGPQGLAAMPQIKSFSHGLHARPLLDVTRDDLQQYAIHHQLNWIEDESNANPQFTRNFLRHEVMPLLTKRWPTVTQTLARTADNCADAQQFIDMTTQWLLRRVTGTSSESLSVKKILRLDPVQQRHVLRAWIYQANFLLPSTVKMQQILQNVLLARADKMPCVSWGEVEVRRYRDDIFLLPRLSQHDASQMICWNLAEPLMLANVGMLQALPVQGQGLRANIENVTVQFRQGGEMLRLPGRKHRHELKKIFQTWGVLPWLRDRIPLIYLNNMLAVVVGYWVEEEFAARNDEAGLNILISQKTK